ncbi:MAG: DUF4783 domain-containing protein [Bacteroidales bacterium]
MKLIQPIVLVLLMAALMGLNSSSGQSPQEKLPSDIRIAFKVGNAKELSRFFNTTIELVILDKEDVYSKVQAEQILDKFFIDYYPKSFKFIHEGGKGESQFAIGQLVTFNGTFRVYLLVKKKNEKPFIHQLRIEKENE